jgi:hypothetical protein
VCWFQCQFCAFGVWFEAVAAYVEPDGRVEGDLLRDEKVGELVMENSGVFGRGEVASGEAPVADRLSHARDQLTHAGFALTGADLAVQVLAGDNVGRGHRPVDRRLDVLLLEDALACRVGNGSRPALPLDLIVGGNSGVREEPVELEGCGFAAGAGDGRGLRGW